MPATLRTAGSDWNTLEAEMQGDAVVRIAVLVDGAELMAFEPEEG